MKPGKIIERLEKLTGPDREVDARIWAALAGVRYQGHNRAYASYGENQLTQVEFTTPPKRTRLATGSARYPHAEPYTASLDAAIALVEKVLPGWGFYLRSDKEGHGCGLVYPDAFRVTPCHCMGTTPAIALLIALFRALAEREG